MRPRFIPLPSRQYNLDDTVPWKDITMPWNELCIQWSVCWLAKQVLNIGDDGKGTVDVRTVHEVTHDMPEVHKERLISLLFTYKGKKIKQTKKQENYRITVRDVQMLLEKELGITVTLIGEENQK